MIRRWLQARKVVRLCDRWRAAMRQLDGEHLGTITNAALLDNLEQLVRQENPDVQSREMIRAGTLWLLEASTIGAEERLRDLERQR